MFTSLISEDDAWLNCVKVVLNLIEDSVFDQVDHQPKVNFDKKRPEWARNNESTETLYLSTPESPGGGGGTISMKRKRSFSETAQDRKLQKLSSSLANDIARSLSVDDVPSLEYKVKNNNGENPIPALRRISLTGTANPTSLHLEQWLSLQANMHNISVAEYQTLFDDKQKSLRHHLDLLQLPNQTFETLRENLSKVLQLADELSGDHTLAFTEIFPEWTVYENKVNKLAVFVQSVEDMYTTVNSVVPQTNDLREDVKTLQKMLDKKMGLYGDALMQNGLEWKAMGLPVDDQLLNATKSWLLNLCNDVLMALDNECKKVQGMVTDMADLVNKPFGDSLMETILMGLEFVSEASTYIGYVTSKLIYDCRALATIYGHWVSENLEPIGDEPDKRAIKRIDIRFMQLFDNMTRVLSTLLTLSEVEVTDEIRAHITSGMIAVENLTSVLVEITVRAIRVMEITKEKTSLTKGMGNIMSNPKTTFIYMGASLLTFADKIVELAGREWMEGGRIQTLHNYLDELEDSIQP